MQYIMYFWFCGWRYVFTYLTIRHHLHILDHVVHGPGNNHVRDVLLQVVKISNIFTTVRHTGWLCRHIQRQQMAHWGEVNDCFVNPLTVVENFNQLKFFVWAKFIQLSIYLLQTWWRQQLRHMHPLHAPQIHASKRMCTSHLWNTLL